MVPHSSPVPPSLRLNQPSQLPDQLRLKSCLLKTPVKVLSLRTELWHLWVICGAGVWGVCRWLLLAQYGQGSVRRERWQHPEKSCDTGRHWVTSSMDQGVPKTTDHQQKMRWRNGRHSHSQLPEKRQNFADIWFQVVSFYNLETTALVFKATRLGILRSSGPRVTM